MRFSIASLVLAVAGVANAASAPPSVSEVCAVAPDTLAITIVHGTYVPGRQVPYAAQDGDQLTPWRYHNWLQRDGKVIGTLLGSAKEALYLPPQLSDEQPLDEAWASAASSYLLLSADDPQFAAGAVPSSVNRKSKPVIMCRTGMHEIKTLRQHQIYLQFPQPLKSGSTYEIRFVQHQPEIPAAVYSHAPRNNRSEAVHVTQVGYRPDDPLKLAFVSLWKGDGGGVEYQEGAAFHVISEEDGQTVFTGALQLAKSAEEGEDARNVNHTLANVYRLDFSSLQQAGRYRVFVEGIGCSWPFTIGKDVWSEAHRTSVRGLLHQRNGIALSPPSSELTRPRPMHPDDGVQVRLSSGTYFRNDGKDTQENRFKDLVGGDTGQTTTQAWGGYMDAADWDRRIEHLDASRALFDLVSAFPEFYRGFTLNIPESGNGLPDAIDEALWGLDCFRRMQQPDGSVPGGIESAEHPRYGEASWQESHPLFQFAPDPASTAMYAATAAQAARVLASYDKPLSELYLESALRAMAYLESAEGSGTLAGFGSSVPDFRNLAAVHLYALTRANNWHELFKRTTAFTKPEGRTARWGKYQQGEAILAYLELDAALTEPNIRANGLRAIRVEADHLIASGEKTAFGWTGDDNLRISWGRLTSPRFCLPLVYAFRVTGETKYLQAMLRAVQYATGANPLNVSFTTGVGSVWPRHITNIDAEVTNQPTPSGITPMGAFETQQMAGWWLNQYIRCYPETSRWPTVEAYFDLGMHTIQNEPTIHRTITPTFYLWGHLAARPELGDGK